MSIGFDDISYRDDAFSIMVEREDLGQTFEIATAQTLDAVLAAIEFLADENKIPTAKFSWKWNPPAGSTLFQPRFDQDVPI